MTAETTQRKTPVSSGRSEGAPAERETPQEDSSVRSHRDTIREWLGRSGMWLREWIVPPNVLTQPPPSFTALTAYAYRGSWTGSLTGFVRGCGTIWLVLIALPIIAGCRYVEWIATRPSRALAAIALWQLFIRTDGPGPWVSSNIIKPFWSTLGWIFIS